MNDKWTDLQWKSFKLGSLLLLATATVLLLLWTFSVPVIFWWIAGIIGVAADVYWWAKFFNHTEGFSKKNDES